MHLAELILFLICLGLLAIGVAVAVIVYMTPDILPRRKKLPGEDTFKDPKNNRQVKFPSLTERASVTLSVVIPAYNEKERLPVMLDECTQYLEARAKSGGGFTYEIIVADDGSKDDTSKVALEWSERLGAERFRVLTLAENRGKGGAVREGVMRARGERILFADADGATKFADLEKLEARLEEQEGGVVCGSRAHLEKESIANRSFFRTFLMVGFHVFVSVFGVRSVRDTQCGFKLFARQAAASCFRSLHIERWAFDVELLKIAEMASIPVSEVAVNWTEIDGSKLDPASASIQMFKDILLLWFRYKLGLWKLTPAQDDKKTS